MLTTIISILIVLLVVLLFVAAVLIFRAMVFGRVPERVEPLAQPQDAANADVTAEHLAQAIRLQTISLLDREKIDPAPFQAMHRLLEELYPRLHSTLKREVVSDLSLLYTWPSRSPDQEAVLLCAHLDVVPVDPASLAEWTQPPFAGQIADGQVWGRGALDTKSTAITTLEAVEGLIRAGYQPERTVYLALGHDEEIGGWRGARCIATLLEQRGVRLAAVLDEGGAVMSGGVPGLNIPAAMVGVAEKGHATFVLTVEGRPGHSSTPPRHTSIGVLARAIARVESAPMPARLSMARLMFADIGAFLPFGLRLALANSGLFAGAIRKQLEKMPQTNALIRTTAAATVIQGGVKENILPAQARAVINCRLLPGDTLEKVRAYIHKTVNDEAVQIDLPEEGAWEASPVSPVDGPVYQSLAKTIRQVYPEAIVAPYLVAGATDSRYYAPLSAAVYRFSPYALDPALLRTIHGSDERIPVEMLGRMVLFYGQIIQEWAGR